MKKPKNATGTGRTRIYLVENCYGDINKVYIGKTKDSREYPHKVKFGPQIIYTYIDEVNSTDRKDWKPLECFWIEQFRQWGFEVMNKNKGGGGLEFHTLDSNLKRSKSLRKYYGDNSPCMKDKKRDSNLKRSKSLRKYYENNDSPMKGKKRDLDFIKKHYKPILQYTLEGNFIKEWPSQVEVYNILGVDINNCLKKRYKTSLGFRWTYKEKDILLKLGPLEGKKKRTQEHRNNISKNKIGKGLKPILQYDLEGNFIKEWESQSEASKKMNLNISCINLCLNRKHKTSGGFKWVYKNQKI